MAYFSTEPASERRNPTGKNRVWDFFPLSNATHPEKRRQPAQPRRKIDPTPAKPVSGIPYWPSRDPIGERGGVNLYGFVGNDGVDRLDILGKSGYFEVKKTFVNGNGPVNFGALGHVEAWGFEVTFTADPSETCTDDNIKLIQVVSYSGQQSSKAFVDVPGSKINKDPKYVGGDPGPRNYEDAPGGNDTSLDITYYFEVCAYCCWSSPNERCLGCARFNFDNKSRNVTPRQDNAETIEGAGGKDYKIPAFLPPTRLFKAGWTKWTWKPR